MESVNESEKKKKKKEKETEEFLHRYFRGKLFKGTTFEKIFRINPVANFRQQNCLEKVGSN
jgi:hypothetical protein